MTFMERRKMYKDQISRERLANRLLKEENAMLKRQVETPLIMGCGNHEAREVFVNSLITIGSVAACIVIAIVAIIWGG